MTDFSGLIGKGAEHETLFSVEEGEVNLAVGAPDTTLLAKASSLFLRGASLALGDPVASSPFLQYGPVQGHSGFLRALAAWLSRHYASPSPSPSPPTALPVSPESLFLTSGATAGLSLACTLFGQARKVLMEDPTYFIAGKVFEDHGMEKVPVPTDAEGVDLARLEALLEGLRPASEPAGPEGTFSCLIYLVPTFNNPTGRVMSLARREGVVRLAARHGALVVCDDVYELLGYSTDPLPPRVAALDRSEGGCVLSNCSFSKIVGPGLRLGWIEAHPSLIRRLCDSGIAASGGSLNQTASGVMLSIIEHGLLDEHLEQVRGAYRSRLQALCGALEQHMPPGVSFEVPRGGYFVWVTLPEQVEAAALLKICKEGPRVGFQPGNWASITGQYRNCLRLSFGFYEEETLVLAAKAIAESLKAMLAKS